MAKTTKKTDEPSKIRISATDTKSAKKTTKVDDKSKVQVKSAVTPGTESKTVRRNPFTAIKDYFVGAWVELRQVHWPNRQATWGLTLAVIIYTLIFVGIIVLLDTGFKALFERILS